MKELWKDVYQYILGGVIVLAFVAVLILMLLKGVDENPVLNTMVGAFASGVIMVITYFFGSSKGSSEKNELLKNGK